MAEMRVVIALAALWVGGLTITPAVAEEIVTAADIFGEHSSGQQLKGWADGKITLRGKTLRTRNLDEILAIQFDRKPDSLSGGDSLVLMASGDRYVISPITVSNDVLTAAWKRNTAQPELKLPLESVAALIFDLPAAMIDRQRLFADFQTLPHGSDILFLANGDKIMGDFKHMDQAFIELVRGSALLKIDRSQVRALRLNPDLTNRSKMEGRRILVTLVDGSHVIATNIELHDREMEISFPLGQQIIVQASFVAACQVYGQNAIPLTDREPTDVTHESYLSTPWPLVRNANVNYGPLALRGKEYPAGLGMHSRTSVTYHLSGDELEFRATVGVDDCSNGLGSVRFVVIVDDRRAWTSDEITGQIAPIEIPPVPLRGAKSLTLFVDFGQMADVSDYANWCDATLIIDPKHTPQQFK